MLTPWVKRLLIANTVVFFATAVIGPELVFEWFAFQPGELILRPWGPVTYMFLHGDLWHLLSNMLVLFFFGPPLEGRWGGREFLRFYFVCGVGGVALSFLFQPDWVVGSMALTSFDDATQRAMLILTEFVTDEEQDVTTARIGLTLPQLACLAALGEELVEAGRPPCPLCGYPMEPAGHSCPKTNGSAAPH